MTTWSSIPVGRVSTSGLVTPQAGDTTGGIKVTATFGGVFGTDQITVKTPSSSVVNLAFLPYSAPITAGQVIAPPIQVQALDVNRHAVAGFTGNITVALGTNPNAATLGGTLTRAAVAGVATFTDLVVNNPDTGYILTATTTISGTTILANIPLVVSAIPGQTGINYHGGSIVYSPKVAALYWSASQIYNGGPPPGTFGSPSADQSLIAFYLNHLGGSPLFDILATYYDGANTPVQNTVAYTQYWADSGAPPTVTGTPDLLTEVERGFASGALTYDSTTLYVVFTGTGVNLGGGFGTQYCAWHTAFQDSVGRLVKISAMPYNHDNNCSEYITAYGSPNNDPAADAEVNVLTHELAENTTDEYGNGWYSDSLGSTGEIGDLCAWNFGPGLGTDYNQVIGGKPFLVQMLWVNAQTVAGAPVGCQQTWSTVAVASARSRMLSHIARRPPVLGRPHIFRPPTGMTLSRQ
jgi:hypothetical protein